LDTILTGDTSADAAKITHILEEVHQTLKNDPELSKSVKFSVSLKGDKDKRRLEKLLHYEGPDGETIKLLHVRGQGWLDDPSTFWRPLSRPDLSHLDPQSQVVGFFLQATQDGS